MLVFLSDKCVLDQTELLINVSYGVIRQLNSVQWADSNVRDQEKMHVTLPAPPLNSAFKQYELHVTVIKSKLD